MKKKTVDKYFKSLLGTVDQNAKILRVTPVFFCLLTNQSTNLTAPIWIPETHSPKKFKLVFKVVLNTKDNFSSVFICLFFFTKLAVCFLRLAFWCLRLILKVIFFLVKNIQSKHLKFQYFLQFWFIFFVLCLYCVNSMTDCLKQFTINPFSYNSCRFSANFGLSDMICTFFLHFTCLRSNFTFWDDKYVFCIYEPDSI